MEARRLQEDLAALGGDDRQDHHGQDERGGQQRTTRGGRGAEERDEAEVFVQPFVAGHQRRAEDGEAPGAVDDRGDRGEQVDDVPDGLRDPGRGVVRDEQRDTDGDRGGDQQRDERRDQRAHHQRADVGPEGRAAGQLGRRCGHRRQRLEDQVQGDQGEHDEDEDAGAQCQAVEDPVARPPCGAAAGQVSWRVGGSHSALGHASLLCWCGSDRTGDDGQPSGARRRSTAVRVIIRSRMVTPGASGVLDGGDRGQGFLLGVTREGGGAGGVGGGLLTLGRQGVRPEGLHPVSGRLVLVGGAVDVVGEQHDRVGRGVLRGAVDLDGHVLRGLATDLLRGGDGPGRGLRGVLDVAVADLDGDGAQAADRRRVGVDDGALGRLGQGDHTGGLLRRLLAGVLGGPGLGGLVRPRVGGGLAQVVGEVLRGARVIGPVHDGDLGVRQGDARVLVGDRRVVPGGDPAGEDLGDGGGVHLDVLLHRGQVVGHGDRRDVGRDAEGTVGAADGLRLLPLVGLQRGVGAGEQVLTVEEAGTTGAGADRVVLDRHTGLGLLEAVDPGGHSGLLGGRATAGQGPGQVARRLRGGGTGLGGGGAGRQAEDQSGGSSDGSADSRDLHEIPFGMMSVEQGPYGVVPERDVRPGR
ncbi:hypothetical protein SDC9_99970 [bioreactor metagenome]|uniref:Uncharacterized protein n=1 Tax=bioreactor metagenome TaxID=1076179 RepID=A0A645AJ00_9ZZZZ